MVKLIKGRVPVRESKKAVKEEFDRELSKKLNNLKKEFIKIYGETRDQKPNDTKNALIDQLGIEDAKFIVATDVIATGDWDERISEKVRSWAKAIAPSKDELKQVNFYSLTGDIHPVHLDQIANAFIKDEVTESKKVSKKVVKEDLDREELKSEVYNALADVAFKHQDATQKDFELAIEWFLIRFFEDEIGFEESKKLENKSIRSLKEGVVKDTEYYTNYDNAKNRAKELGLELAEYGDVFGKDVSYSVWNTSGKRGDHEDVVAFYNLDGSDLSPEWIKDYEYYGYEFLDKLEEDLEESLENPKVLCNHCLEALEEKEGKQPTRLIPEAEGHVCDFCGDNIAEEYYQVF